MQFTDLLTSVNHLATKDEVVIYFKALRQDEIIWEGVQDLQEIPPVLKNSLIRADRWIPGRSASYPSTRSLT